LKIIVFHFQINKSSNFQIKILLLRQSKAGYLGLHLIIIKMDAGPGHRYQHEQSASLYAKGKRERSCAVRSKPSPAAGK
jgi:hypothetical protein